MEGVAQVSVSPVWVMISLRSQIGASGVTIDERGDACHVLAPWRVAVVAFTGKFLHKRLSYPHCDVVFQCTRVAREEVDARTMGGDEDDRLGGDVVCNGNS